MKAALANVASSQILQFGFVYFFHYLSALNMYIIDL